LDEDSFQQLVIPILEIAVKVISVELIVALLVVFVLLFFSALLSGSEAAYFSLSPSDRQSINKSDSGSARMATVLLEMPDRLLATILVANNLVNIAIIIVSSFISNSIFDFSSSEVLGFLIEVVIITSLIVFFGEILPKIYAIKFSEKLARSMAIPLYILEKVFRPLNFILIKSSYAINKRINLPAAGDISINELSSALELTNEDIIDERKILKSIVKFGNIDVREIMTPRVDIVGTNMKAKFSSLVKKITDSGYSRIPVYDKELDNIKGILYVKDLLPYLDKSDSFSWHNLIRTTYFVPETKKINQLLKEFQTSKIHLAVVVDEYGGTSGIISLEDILEEIVGEITDESDDEDLTYVKLDENNYLFEAKILLNDFFKIIQADESIFDDVKGEAETLAGLILEMQSELPKKNEVIACKDFIFTVKSVDKRRIKQVQVTIQTNNNA